MLGGHHLFYVFRLLHFSPQPCELRLIKNDVNKGSFNEDQMKKHSVLDLCLGLCVRKGRGTAGKKWGDSRLQWFSHLSGYLCTV